MSVVNSSSAADLEEVKALCKRSLRFLCRNMLWAGQPEEKRLWGKVHDDLEKFLLKPTPKKAILLPRGHHKSSVVTVGKSIQHILVNPNVRILIANQVWDMSRDFLRSIKGYLETSQLQYLFGPFVSARWNEDAMIVRQRTNKGLKEPTVQTTGLEAEKTGGHYDVIILDDLTGLTNVGTVEQREKTKRFRRSMVDLLEPGGVIYEVGTRWHLDDTFGEIMEKESKYYDMMSRAVVEDGRVIFPEKFAKRFDPVKKTWSVGDDRCMDFIQHLRDSKTSAEFTAQYMNNPVDEETQVFKPGFFKYYTRTVDGMFKCMVVDPAITEKAGADRTAIVVVGMDPHRNIYVLDYLAGRWGASDIIKNIFSMWERFYPNVVGMESMGFQRVLKFALEREMRERRQFFPIEELRSPNLTNAKEQRVKALEPFYRRGDVWHHETMRGKDLETELLTFPKGKHDDLIDALAYSLQLMVPGQVETPRERVVGGSWEFFRKQAMDAQFQGKDFFHHG